MPLTPGLSIRNPHSEILNHLPFLAFLAVTFTEKDPPQIFSP
jgi:hypothetical protein